MLRLESVTKRFGARTVLNGLSLAVAPGEFVAVTGESGIGKSTLLNVVAGLEPVDAGRIFLFERELTALDDDALALLRREKLGFIFQAFHLLPHLTVLENVALPLLLRKERKDVMEGKARSLLAAVGLAGRERSMPRELSGGELQRVAIARALVGEPALLLADEPTGNLDPDSARQVMRLLRERAREQGAAVVLVTHADWAAAQADRAYRLTAQGAERLAIPSG
ncbi:MAG TPA: ABC transporter ATP-binding protein [Burkholderiales bacterium]|nr:ABC transporter ATP-binding protein [Burkholderiales bacterium]